MQVHILDDSVIFLYLQITYACIDMIHTLSYFKHACTAYFVALYTKTHTKVDTVHAISKSYNAKQLCSEMLA